MEEFTGSDQKRSLFLENAAWGHIAKPRRDQRNARDIELINQRADYLNQEVLDALSYQVAA